MKLELKHLALRNFKGVNEVAIDFGKETWIYGRNGSGKTSLFDSFIWCLFGKDHLNRSDFELKPYDENGKTIPRTDVEVEAVILIDGTERKLRRLYCEKWVKPKTEENEVFDSNTTKYYIDDVIVKKSEYDAFVAGICDEIVFKTVTNPAYFPRMSENEQRRMLFSFINITDEDVATSNNDFAQLLKEINGMSFETFRKDINAKKLRVKTELAGLPERIAGLKEGMPTLPNEAEVSKQISEKQSRVDEIDNSLNDTAQNMSVKNQERMNVQSDINKLELNNQQIEHDFLTKKNTEISEHKRRIQELESSVADFRIKESQRASKIAALNSERTKKSEQLNQLRVQWKLVNEEQLIFPDGAFQCPACQRLLEVSDIESKQAELTANFNHSKAKKVEENKTSGLAVSARIKEIDSELASLAEVEKPEFFAGTRINILNDELAKIEASKEDYKRMESYIENLAKINGLKITLNDIQNVDDNSHLIAEKRSITAELDELKSKLALKNVVENTKVRIEQLENLIKSHNQELANLERREYLMKQFEFEKNTMYEKRINQMFRFVKFRLFHTQVDGQIVPDFECMVDGVPYSTLNNAMQVAAGLDIINTISKCESITAPIFLDNRESVTQIPEMETQIINLVVSPEFSELTIQKGENQQNLSL